MKFFSRIMKFFTLGFATVGFFVVLIIVGIFWMASSTISAFKNELPSHQSPASHSKKYFAGIRLNTEIFDKVADDVNQKFERAMNDPKAAGVFFEINSPGGMVVPSQEIYDEVIKVKAKKPVVAYVRSLDASGAFYSSIPSTKIVANRGSLIGSLGVVMQSFETTQLVKFLKLKPVTLKTGALKDAGSPLRPMTSQDKKYLEGLIGSMRSQFAADVKKARNLDDKTMDYLSDARVVLAPEALKLKIIDKVGSRDDAVSELVTLSKSDKNTKVYYYGEKKTFAAILSQKMANGFSEGISGGVTKTLSETLSPKLKGSY